MEFCAVRVSATELDLSPKDTFIKSGQTTKQEHFIMHIICISPNHALGRSAYSFEMFCEL